MKSTQFVLFLLVLAMLSLSVSATHPALITVEPSQQNIVVGDEFSLKVYLSLPAGTDTLYSALVIFKKEGSTFDFNGALGPTTGGVIFSPLQQNEMSGTPLGSTWTMKADGGGINTYDLSTTKALLGTIPVKATAAGNLVVTVDYNSLLQLADDFSGYHYYTGQLVFTPITITGAVAAASCGDGTVNDAEQCDDGNTVDGDGCSSTCTDEAAPDTNCGNGVLDGGEKCDGTLFYAGFVDGETTCAFQSYTAGTVTCDDSCQGLSYAGCFNDVGGQCTGTPPADAHACSEVSPTSDMVYSLWSELECPSNFDKCRYICNDGYYYTGVSSVGSNPYRCEPIPVNCGNGALDSGEICDGALFQSGTTCVSQSSSDTGYIGGTLTCGNGCNVFSRQNCVLAACSDELDNDDDDLYDYDDPGCHSDGDPTTDNYFDASDNSEEDSGTAVLVCTTDLDCSSGLNCVNSQCTGVLQQIKVKLEDSNLSLIQRISAIAQILRAYLASS